MKQKCDVCLGPATHGVRDVREIDDPMLTYTKFEVVGEPRWGCEMHPVYSNTHKDGKIVPTEMYNHFPDDEKT